MSSRFHRDSLGSTLAAVESLLRELAAAGEQHADAIASAPHGCRADVRNLVHYLAARRHDLRPLQQRLRALSLSSLGRMESDVLDTLQGVRLALLALLGELPAGAGDVDPAFDGDARLFANAATALGDEPPARRTRIMVTLPSAAADDPAIVQELLRSGMNVARINLAHDDAAAWTRMVEHVRREAAALGRPCRILADLPGPKLRTGPIVSGPRLVKVKPERDAFGRCASPATVAFVDAGAGPGGGVTATIPLRRPLAAFAIPGDELVLRDTRLRQRRLTVVSVHADHCLATIDRTAYLLADSPITLVRGITALTSSRIGDLPPIPGSILLRTDDVLVLTRMPWPGHAAEALGDAATTPATVSCTLPQVFDVAVADQPILFDDGKIAGLVVANEGDRLRIRITAAAKGGVRLRAEKGINLPGLELPVPAITDDDQPRLDWIVRHADLVGLSFAQREQDVVSLQHELARRGRGDLGIVLKIETAVGFQRLPEMLLAGLRRGPLAVMVARGDLAVDVGFARLAEIQEEVLWLCEAARVPVIWATQVLDSMARTGMPSRAEVTDAAMSVRAECVMLNKGPHIVPTVRFLDGVLQRMQQHTAKKRALLRRLRVADAPAALHAANAQSTSTTGMVPAAHDHVRDLCQP